MTDMTDELRRLREIEAREGINSESLAKMKDLLAEWAHRHEFPADRYPAPTEGSAFYLVDEPPDGRFGLYVNVASPGKQTAPHSHHTWSIAVAIRGRELSRLYRAGEAKLEVVEESVLEPGDADVMMPEDIHGVAVLGDEPTLQLHLYGRTFPHFEDLTFYDWDSGRARSAPPPKALAPR